MNYEIPERTAETDMVYDTSGRLVMSVEHFRQIDNSYDIVHHYDENGNEIVPKEAIMRYSVRSIIRELKAIGRFYAVRKMLETANFDWDFVGSNYLAAGDVDFQAMLSAVVENGIMTQAELDAMLPKCVWSAD